MKQCSSLRDFVQLFCFLPQLTLLLATASFKALVFLDREAPHRPTNNPNASKFAQKPGGSNVCPQCRKTVHAAEKVTGGGNVRERSTQLSQFMNHALN